MLRCKAFRDLSPDQRSLLSPRNRIGYMFLSGNLAPVEQGMVTLNYYVIGLIERGDATCPYVALSSEMQPLLRGFKEELKDILEVLTRNTSE